jgi:hypothetical protein
MSLIDQIQDALVHRFGLTQSSAVTQAVAYVIFNRHGNALVANVAALDREMVFNACRHVADLAQNFAWLPKVAPTRDPRVIQVLYIGKRAVDTCDYAVWVHGLKRIAVDAVALGRERGYGRGCIRFRVKFAAS